MCPVIQRLSQSITRPERDTLIAIALLVGAIAFNLIALYPEVSIQAPDLNDDVMHRLALDNAVVASSSGMDPTDTWFHQSPWASPSSTITNICPTCSRRWPIACYRPPSRWGASTTGCAIFF